MKKIILYSTLLFATMLLFGVAVASNNNAKIEKEKAIKLKLATPIQVPDTLNVSAQIAEINADAVSFGLNRVTFIGSLVFEKLPNSQRGRVEWHSIEMTTQGKKTVSEQLTFPLRSQFRTKAELININETIMAKGNIEALEEALQNLALKEKKPVEVTTAKDAGTFTAEGGTDSVKNDKDGDDNGQNPFVFEEPTPPETEDKGIFRQETVFCNSRYVDREAMLAYANYKQMTYEDGQLTIETNCTYSNDESVPLQIKVCGYEHDFETDFSYEKQQFFYNEPLYNNIEVNAGQCERTEKRYRMYLTDQGCVDDTSLQNEGIVVEYTRHAIDTDEEGTVICDDCTKNATFKTEVIICPDRIIDIQRLQALEQDKTVVTRRNERNPDTPFLPYSDSGCDLNGNFVELLIEEKGYAHHLNDDPEVPGYSRRAVQYYYIEPNQNNKRFNIGDTTEIGQDLEHFVTRNTCPVTQVGQYILPNYRKAFEDRFENEQYATHCYPHSDQILVQKETRPMPDSFEHNFDTGMSYYITRTFFVDPITEEKEILTPYQRDETHSMPHQKKHINWRHDDENVQSIQEVETFITLRDPLTIPAEDPDDPPTILTELTIKVLHDLTAIPYEHLGITDELVTFREDTTYTIPTGVKKLTRTIMVGGGGACNWYDIGPVYPYTWLPSRNGNSGTVVKYLDPITVIPGETIVVKIGMPGSFSAIISAAGVGEQTIVPGTVTTLTSNFNGVANTVLTANPGAIGGGGSTTGFTLTEQELNVGAGTPGIPGAFESNNWNPNNAAAFKRMNLPMFHYVLWLNSTESSLGFSWSSNSGTKGGATIEFTTEKWLRPDGTFYYISSE